MIYDILPMWQPWASLVVNINPETGKAWKQVETRSMLTRKRGTVLIYACKTMVAYKSISISDHNMDGALNCIEFGKEQRGTIPFGFIIGSVDIVDCGKIDVAFGNAMVKLTPPSLLDTEYKAGALFIEPIEQSFGDYQTGRYGWLLDNPKLLKNPITFKTNQGWGKYSTEEELEFI